MMTDILCVMAAGAIGAVARWGTDNLFKHWLGPLFPYGTLVVNVLGCFLFGVFMQLDSQNGGYTKPVRLLVTSGFLGAFTTFSTFGFNTYSFLKTGQYISAAVNVSANIILGILAVWAGAVIAKSIA